MAKAKTKAKRVPVTINGTALKSRGGSQELARVRAAPPPRDTKKALVGRPTNADDVDALLLQQSTAPAPDLLLRINDCVSRVQAIRARLENYSKVASELMDEETTLVEQTIPGLMTEGNLQSLSLADDFKLEKKQNVYANISKEKMRDAIAWFEKNKYEGIIKYAFAIPVAKGDKKGAAALRALLKKHKIPVEESSGVHPQTLLAFVRESLEEARALPTCIGVHTKDVAVLSKAKK